MKNLQSLFYLLVFFFILINVIIEALPVFLIIIGIGVIVFIIVKIYNGKKAKKLEFVNKEREKIRAIQKERNQKIQQIQQKCIPLTPSLNEEIIVKQEKILKNAQSLKPKTGYDQIFIDVNVKRNQLKYDIYKCALSCIEAIKQDTFNEIMALELDRLITEYKQNQFTADGFVISDFRKDAFRKLSETIADIRSKSFTLLTWKSNLSNLNLYNGSRQGYSLNHNCFLNVKSSEEIIHLSCQKTSLYIYPLFIVDASNKENFTIYPWNILSFSVRKIRAYTKGYGSGIKGAIEIGHTYEHTCIDGSPDMRYKHNDIYRTYNVFVLLCKQIPWLNFIVANESLAYRLVQCFNYYATLKEPKRNIENTTIDDTEKSNFASLLSELEHTISEYGIGIITSKKLFYIISDSGCFKNDAKARNLFKELFNDYVLDRFLIFHMKQPEIETLALLYSYKFNYPVEECLLFINNIKSVLSKYRMEDL